MTRPVVGSVAEEIYSGQVAFQVGDEARGWVLLHLCEALGMQQQVVHDIAVDTEDDHAAWSVIWNVERCPEWALPWLGMVRGVRFPQWITSVETKRQWIREVAGQKRGRPASLVEAVAATLTGSKTVVLRERYRAEDPDELDPDTAYHIQVRTRSAETPDPAFTARVAEAAKLGGLLLDYEAVDGQDWQQVVDTHATWVDLAAAYPTWQDVVDEPIGD